MVPKKIQTSHHVQATSECNATQRKDFRNVFKSKKQSLKKWKFLSVGLFLLNLSGSFDAYAQSPSEPRISNPSSFDYPELMVTPLASKRIEMEAEEESDRQWTGWLAHMVPAAMTFTGGLLQVSSVDLNSDPNRHSPLIGSLVGGSWLTIYTLLALYDTPYADAQKKLAAMPSKTKRQRLAKERFAEQALYRPAQLANLLAWSQLATQLGANIYLLSQSKNGSINSFFPALSIATTLLPLFFKTRWQDVANEHRMYRKRIYGPVVEGTFFTQRNSGQLTPGLVARFFL